MRLFALSHAPPRAQAGNHVVDVFALPPAGGRACLDLASLAPLPRACGGALFHYPNGPGDAPLARDVHRLLRRGDAAGAHAAPTGADATLAPPVHPCSQPTALFATLRLRTSPELRAVRAHGHVAADAAFEGVFHMTTCGCASPNSVASSSTARAAPGGLIRFCVRAPPLQAA